MTAISYKSPEHLLTRHAYLENAGEYYRQATAPESQEHQYSYIYDASAFELLVAAQLRRTQRGSSRQIRTFFILEQEYLRVLRQVFFDTHLEYVEQINSLSDQYAGSKKFGETPDPFPSWDYIQGHINNTKALFEYLAADAESSTLHGISETWARHYKRMLVAIKTTARIRKQMADSILLSKQKQREVESFEMARCANVIAKRSESHGKISKWAAILAAVLALLALVNIQNLKDIGERLREELAQPPPSDPSKLPSPDALPSPNGTATSAPSASVPPQNNAAPLAAPIAGAQ